MCHTVAMHIAAQKRKKGLPHDGEGLFLEDLWLTA